MVTAKNEHLEVHLKAGDSQRPTPGGEMVVTLWYETFEVAPE
jgi:hypothetical protein